MPMLAKIVEGIPDARRQVAGQAALAEYKYDGVRAQIHLLPDRSVKIFSRNSEVGAVAENTFVHVNSLSATLNFTFTPWNFEICPSRMLQTLA